jgi:molybdate transport system regulatory protein
MAAFGSVGRAAGRRHIFTICSESTARVGPLIPSTWGDLHRNSSRVNVLRSLAAHGNAEFLICTRLAGYTPRSFPRIVVSMAKLRLSIVLDSGARIGPGKAALLESIRDTGSISAAARDMGMSYKRAWLLLDSMNQAFTEPVVTAAPGGTHGGGASLTAFGAELLERYRRLEKTAARLAGADMAALARRARPEAGPKI